MDIFMDFIFIAKLMSRTEITYKATSNKWAFYFHQTPSPLYVIKYLFI